MSEGVNVKKRKYRCHGEGYRCQWVSVSAGIGVSKKEANSVQIACERLLANEKDLAQRYQYVQHSNVVIMVLTSSQQAALRAKKALANGNTNFKPRGASSKAAFEALKEQGREAQTNSNASNSACETPLQRRTHKIYKNQIYSS